MALRYTESDPGQRDICAGISHGERSDMRDALHVPCHVGGASGNFKCSS
jgi:hypothetical protein